MIGTVFNEHWFNNNQHPAIFTQASDFNFAKATQNQGFADVIDQVLPTVVSVYHIKSEHIPNTAILGDPHYQQFVNTNLSKLRDTTASLGSGVIINPAGYIVTNHHVIEDADKVEVELFDGRIAPATLVGEDPETDLAVLKIDLPNLQAISIAEENTTRVGDISLAIGNPHGLGTSVSMGVISALERTALGISTFESFIQADVHINQGNSGGPLVNTQGQLIGINAAKLHNTKIHNTKNIISSQGIGLAIPTATIVDIATKLITKGDVERSWLGVTLRLFSQQGTRRKALNKYLFVNDVFIGGPADKAGLQTGDIIISFDGIHNQSPRGMMDYIANLTPGTPVSAEYMRFGSHFKTTITLAKRPASK